MTFLEGLDRFVRVSRLDRLALTQRPRPRPLRWLPVATLAGAVAGYVLLVQAIGGSLPFPEILPRAIGGGLLFFGSLAAAGFLRYFGPRLGGAADEPLDEREREVTARAGSIAGTMIAVVAVFGCYYQGLAGVFGWWRPQTTLEWIYLGMGLQIVAPTLRVIAASWLEPPLRDEAE